MVLGLRLLICIFFINVVAATSQKSNFSTICFWDGFSRWRRRPYNSVVSDIPAEACSAVVYSHVTVDDKSGWIRLTDKELELDPEAKSNANSWMYYPMWLLPPNKVFAQMGNLKRRNSKLKLLLAVGGPHESVEKYWQLFSKAHLWKDMAGSLVKWLKTYEFDGVVLDFFSGAGSLHDSFRNWDNAKFIHPFLKQINHGLKDDTKDWSITFTLPAFDSATHHLFDFEKLAELVMKNARIFIPKAQTLKTGKTSTTKMHVRAASAIPCYFMPLHSALKAPNDPKTGDLLSLNHSMARLKKKYFTLIAPAVNNREIYKV